MFKQKLACSFCRRSEAEVEKLVAGPRVYICDRCAAEVIRIMTDSDHADTVARQSRRVSLRTILGRFQDFWRRGIGSISRHQSTANPVPLKMLAIDLRDRVHMVVAPTAAR